MQSSVGFAADGGLTVSASAASAASSLAPAAAAASSSGSKRKGSEDGGAVSSSKRLKDVFGSASACGGLSAASALPSVHLQPAAFEQFWQSTFARFDDIDRRRTHTGELLRAIHNLALSDVNAGALLGRAVLSSEPVLLDACVPGLRGGRTILLQIIACLLSPHGAADVKQCADPLLSALTARVREDGFDAALVDDGGASIFHAAVLGMHQQPALGRRWLELLGACLSQRSVSFDVLHRVDSAGLSVLQRLARDVSAHPLLCAEAMSMVAATFSRLVAGRPKGDELLARAINSVSIGGYTVLHQFVRFHRVEAMLAWMVSLSWQQLLLLDLVSAPSNPRLLSVSDAATRASREHPLYTPARLLCHVLQTMRKWQRAAPSFPGAAGTLDERDLHAMFDAIDVGSVASATASAAAAASPSLLVPFSRSDDRDAWMLVSAVSEETKPAAVAAATSSASPAAVALCRMDDSEERKSSDLEESAAVETTLAQSHGWVYRDDAQWNGSVFPSHSSTGYTPSSLHTFLRDVQARLPDLILSATVTDLLSRASNQSDPEAELSAAHLLLHGLFHAPHAVDLMQRAASLGHTAPLLTGILRLSPPAMQALSPALPQLLALLQRNRLLCWRARAVSLLLSGHADPAHFGSEQSVRWALLDLLLSRSMRPDFPAENEPPSSLNQAVDLHSLWNPTSGWLDRVVAGGAHVSAFDRLIRLLHSAGVVSRDWIWSQAVSASNAPVVQHFLSRGWVQHSDWLRAPSLSRRKAPSAYTLSRTPNARFDSLLVTQAIEAAERRWVGELVPMLRLLVQQWIIPELENIVHEYLQPIPPEYRMPAVSAHAPVTVMTGMPGWGRMLLAMPVTPLWRALRPPPSAHTDQWPREDEIDPHLRALAESAAVEAGEFEEHQAEEGYDYQRSDYGGYDGYDSDGYEWWRDDWIEQELRTEEKFEAELATSEEDQAYARAFGSEPYNYLH